MCSDTRFNATLQSTLPADQCHVHKEIKLTHRVRPRVDPFLQICCMSPALIAKPLERPTSTGISPFAAPTQCIHRNTVTFLSGKDMSTPLLFSSKQDCMNILSRICQLSINQSHHSHRWFSGKISRCHLSQINSASPGFEYVLLPKDIKCIILTNH
jgi:hypothetical protein